MIIIFIQFMLWHNLKNTNYRNDNILVNILYHILKQWIFKITFIFIMQFIIHCMRYFGITIINEWMFITNTLCLKHVNLWWNFLKCKCCGYKGYKIGKYIYWTQFNYIILRELLRYIHGINAKHDAQFILYGVIDLLCLINWSSGDFCVLSFNGIVLL